MRTRCRIALPGGIALAIGAALSCADDRTTRAEPSAAERLYGPAPPRDGSINYQPDVVLVDRGPESIRGPSRDGLTWTIDARGGSSQAIVPGKIMFASGRVVGRVLAATATADGLAVVLGPVALTDVIRDAHFEFEQPLDLGKATVYTAPAFPGASVSSPLAASRLPRLLLAAGPSDLRVLPVSAASPGSYGRFKIDSFGDLGRLGLSFDSDAGGVRLTGGMTLSLGAPRLQVGLTISGGTLKTAYLRLLGAAGIRVFFEAANDVGVSGNFTETILLPVDFSFFSGVPPPFAVTMRQALIVKMMFSSKGRLKAAGSYSLDGGVSFGYYDGSFIVGGPSAKQQGNLLDSVQGISLGPNGLVITHQAKLIVGIGGFGFVTGPYVALNTGVGVARGSSIGISRHPVLPADKEACRETTLDMKLAGGVGYSIPQVVTDAINFFVSGLNSVLQTKIPAISGQGGIELKPQRPLHSERHLEPNTKLCRDTLGGQAG